MEREIGDDIFSICLDKLKFVLSEGIEQQKLRPKKNFRSQCSSQFYKELRETVLILEDNSEQMRNKNEDLEHLDFALGKFIQFIVDEGRFDRLKDRKVRPRNLGIESLYLEIDDCIGDLIGKDEDEGILFKFEFIQNRINPYISKLSRSLTSLTKAPKTMALLVKLTKFATEFFPNDLAFSNTLEDLESVEDGVKIINCMSKILAEREANMSQLLDIDDYESNLSAAMKSMKSKRAVIFYHRHLSYAQIPYPFNFVKANLFTFLLSELRQDKDLSKEQCENFLLLDIHNLLPFAKAKPLSLKNVSECFEDEKPMEKAAPAKRGSRGKTTQKVTVGRKSRREEEVSYMDTSLGHDDHGTGVNKAYRQKEKHESKVLEERKQLGRQKRSYSPKNESTPQKRVPTRKEDSPREAAHDRVNSRREELPSRREEVPKSNRREEQKAMSNVHALPIVPKQKESKLLRVVITHADGSVTYDDLHQSEFTSKNKVFFGSTSGCILRINGKNVSDIQGMITFEDNKFYMKCYSIKNLTLFRIPQSDQIPVKKDDYIFLNDESTFIIEDSTQGSSPWLLLSEYYLNGFKTVLQGREEEEFTFGVSQNADHQLPNRKEISNKQFRIGFNYAIGWYISDGSQNSPSTNGTFMSLKSCQDFLTKKYSVPFHLFGKMEFQIGDTELQTEVVDLFLQIRRYFSFYQRKK